MAGSTISSRVTLSVTLGSAAYLSPLTIAPAGYIDPSAGRLYGVTALVATIAGGSVLNQGTVGGGAGSVLGALSPGDGGAGVYTGGIGVDLIGGSLTNTGSIAGGAGGYNGSTSVGFAGGSAITGTDSALTNDGTISGGSGGSGDADFDGSSGAAAGSGAELTNSSLTNNGLIAGGAGGSLTYGPGGAGDGGDGVDASGSSLANAGTIVAGNGGAGAPAFLNNNNPAGSGGVGVSLAASSSLVNTGSIAGGSAGYNAQGRPGGAAGTGVDVANSSLTNAGAGDITGGAGGTGVYVTGGTVTNSGAIGGGGGNSGGPGGAGIALASGSILANTGDIAGGSAGSPQTGIGGAFFNSGGVGASAANSTLTNNGTIAGGFGGGNGTGVDLTSSILTNNGLIAAGAAFANGFDNGNGGVYAVNSTLTNTGVIAGTYGFYGGAGVNLTTSNLTNGGTITAGTGFYGGAGVDVTGGTVVNNGTIAGGDGSSPSAGHAGVGVLFNGGGRLIDAGFISGGSGPPGTADAVDFSGTGTDMLVIDPGAGFVGNVVAQGTSATLRLAAAPGTGTIVGIGTSFTGFGTIVVNAGATWVASGSVAGSGTISLDARSRLTLDAGVTATSPVEFVASTGTLALADPANFAASVYGLQPGDAIDFTSITSTGSISAGVNGSNDLTLTSNGVLLTEIKLDPTQSFTADAFRAAPDGGTGTVVTETPLCFLAGTLIATPSGETPVERLRPGDIVITARGEPRPIVWIGTGRVRAARHRRSAATPVIVRKGALADNLPHRDLRLTKAHALGFEDVLIPVEFLVNHRSILWDDMAQEVVLYHIELETHDVLLADGAPAESYRDDGNRWLFRNANSGWGLPPKPPCAPVLTGGPVVDATWRRLLDRAGPRPGLPTTHDPDLHLIIDGQPVRGSVEADGVHLFRLPSRPASARIVSRSAVPAELGLARDPRQLGVGVRRLALRQSARFRVMQVSDHRLNTGFHAFEAAQAVRWTDGDAPLPQPLFEGFDGPMELMLQLGATTRYPLGGAEPARMAV